MIKNGLKIVILIGLVTSASALAVQVSVNTLRSVYKAYFPIGTAVNKFTLRDSRKAKFIPQQFASVTSEDQLKPFVVQPQEGKFSWADADTLISYAQKNDMLVRGHCLVWEKRMPSWFYKSNGSLVNKQVLLKRLENHITTTVNRYKGKIYCWDVVNEAISWNSGEIFNSTDTLYQILGEDYIKKAFEFAHKADPNAQLFYNDVGFEDVSRRNKIYTLIKRLKLQGVPITGVGMQCHLGIKGVNESLLRENIKLFSKLGLKIQITELDVSIYDKVKKERLVGVSEDYSMNIQTRQAAIYEMVFRVCRENKDRVNGITLWGACDGNNYLTKSLNKKNYPYLFDQDLKPKKAYFAVTDF